ncbi:MAG: hypothetical protein JWN44_682 [Myxococcales bacterium]|nr:hypothetical protein [Myxococcales bacterium]
MHARAISTLASADRVAHALPVEWLPIEIDVEVVDTIARALPRAGFESLIEDRQRQEMGSALFKTFIAATGKLFGFTPAMMIRHLGKGWRQVLQDCGVVEVAATESRAATVWLRQLPQVCLDSSAWIGALRPGMRMLYELVDSRGDVTVTVHGRDVQLRFNW